MNAEDLVGYHGNLAAAWAKDEESPNLAAKHAAFHAGAARLCAVLGARAAALERIEQAHAKGHEGLFTEEEVCLEIGHALEELSEKIGERGEASAVAGECAICGHRAAHHLGVLQCRAIVISRRTGLAHFCSCEAFIQTTEERGEPMAFDPTGGADE